MNRIYTDQAQAFEIIARRNNDFKLTVTIDPVDEDFDINSYDFKFVVQNRHTQEELFAITGLEPDGLNIIIERSFDEMDYEDEGYIYFLIGEKAGSRITFLASKFRIRDGISQNEAVNIEYQLQYGVNLPNYITSVAITNGHLLITLSNGEILDAGVVGDTITIDQAIIDGSSNPVSGNAVYDALQNIQTENEVIDGSTQPVSGNAVYDFVMDRIESLNGGNITFEADGITSSFQIEHGFTQDGEPAVPEYYSVTALNTDAQPGDYNVSVDENNITVTYPNVYPFGSIKFAWSTNKDQDIAQESVTNILVTSAPSLTLSSVYTGYIFKGSTCTMTLPAPVGDVVWSPIHNQGTGNITLVGPMYYDSVETEFIIAPGQAFIVTDDGVRFSIT